MNFNSVIIESVYILMKLYGYNNSKVEEFARVVKRYDKGTTTRKAIKNKFEELVKNQTTDKKVNERIKEIIWCYVLLV